MPREESLIDRLDAHDCHVMKRYAYRVETSETFDSPCADINEGASALPFLNRLGDEGWPLVAILEPWKGDDDIVSGANIQVLIFMQEKR